LSSSNHSECFHRCMNSEGFQQSLSTSRLGGMGHETKRKSHQSRRSYGRQLETDLRHIENLGSEACTL
jgi:hypothetical protein